ncbi:2-amino-4-hydroxy-6-hydroxymethyldihydropteridine diphosphokinase [Limnohabitans sp.]|uniref:2-amino-4-hydroxy-6- hydroxymethyldihydropteridine diphosphokinase n=1 Tax=Limnohabitans sp. TaxID=1907725 RepID=UPI0033407AD1
MQTSVRDAVTAWVALGANLGDARQAVLQAFEALNHLPGTRLTGRSRLYRSAPYEAQGPDFVNAVAQLDTSLSAPELLNALQALEALAGRQRPYVNAPRTLDLDLIFYGQSHIDSPRLQVPHPRWRERAFVLLPLADIWPDQVSAEDRARVADQPIEVLPEDKA